MHYDLGYFDDEIYRLEPIGNPFGPKVSPRRPERTVTYVTGMCLKKLEPAVGLEPTTC